MPPLVTPSLVSHLVYHNVRSTLAKGYPKPTLAPLVAELWDYRLLITGRFLVNLVRNSETIVEMTVLIRRNREMVETMRKMAVEGHPDADALFYLAQMYVQESANAVELIQEIQGG